MDTTYQDRLKIEYEELNKKIEKLETFIKGDIYKTLEFGEQLDMKEQLSVMQNYSRILLRRLKRKGLI